MIKLKPTGTFHKQWVRCGKPNCKCTKGQLHGPYWYYFFRGYFDTWNDIKTRRVGDNKLLKIYVPHRKLKEFVKQEKETRSWPKLTLALIRHLKDRHIKPLAKILETAYKKQDVETIKWAEAEFVKLWAFLQTIYKTSEEANPPESPKLDLAQIELGQLIVLTAFALGTKQSTGKFEYGLPRL